MKIIKSELTSGGSYHPDEDLIEIDKDLDRFPKLKKYIIKHETEHYHNDKLGLKGFFKNIVLEWKTDLYGAFKKISKDVVRYDQYKSKKIKINKLILNRLHTLLVFILRIPTTIIRTLLMNIFYFKHKKIRLLVYNLIMGGLLIYLILKLFHII